MPISGLKGFSTQAVNALIAAYGNDMVNLATGTGGGLALTPNNNVEFESFLGSLFFTNGIDRMLTTANGFNWTTLHVARTPLGKYIKVWRSRSRIYLGFISLQNTLYPSRVWYTDLPKNRIAQWGFEYGNNLVTHANNQSISANGAGFKTYGIKRGDPIFILTGNDIGQYTVSSVDADQQITLIEKLTTEATGISYWVGGNFFDVGSDDGDFITWLEENNDNLTIYKRDSLYRISASDGSNIIKIRGAYGTTSGRSVVNLHELSIYFYAGVGLATGFYAYNGVYSQKISSPIDNHIQGMNIATKVVAWKEGELYRAYIGSLSSIPNNEVEQSILSNCIATWDYVTKTWSIDPIPDTPIVTTEFRQSVIKFSYFGNSNSQVMLTPQGGSANGLVLPFQFTMNAIYPAGTANIVTMSRLQVISSQMEGVIVQYRLKLNPFGTQKQFRGLGQITTDLTEFFFDLSSPEASQASGIELRFLGIDNTTPVGVIEKVCLFWKPKTSTRQ